MRLAQRLAPSLLLILMTRTVGLAQATATARQPDPTRESPIPPWKRYLTNEEATRVEELEKQIERLRREGRFAEAIEPAVKVVAILEKWARPPAADGPGWFYARSAKQTVEGLRTISKLPPEGQREMASAFALQERAKPLVRQRRYAEAEGLLRSIADHTRRGMGEDHPDTVDAVRSLAFNLNAQRRFADAEPLLREALRIRRRSLGEAQVETITAPDRAGSPRPNRCIAGP